MCSELGVVVSVNKEKRWKETERKSIFSDCVKSRCKQKAERRKEICHKCKNCTWLI